MGKNKNKQADFGDVVALPFIGYQAKPVYIVATKWGRVAVRVHNAETLTAENVGGYTVAQEQGREYGQGEPEFLTVRGIDYTACATFGPPLDLQREPEFFTCSRRGSFSRDSASYPARKSLVEILRGAVAVLLDTHGEALAIAQALECIDKRTAASEALDKAAAALDSATAALADAEAAAGAAAQEVAKRGIDFAPFARNRSRD